MVLEGRLRAALETYNSAAMNSIILEYLNAFFTELIDNSVDAAEIVARELGSIEKTIYYSGKIDNDIESTWTKYFYEKILTIEDILNEIVTSIKARVYVGIESGMSERLHPSLFQEREEIGNRELHPEPSSGERSRNNKIISDEEDPFKSFKDMINQFVLESYLANLYEKDDPVHFCQKLRNIWENMGKFESKINETWNKLAKNAETYILAAVDGLELILNYYKTFLTEKWKGCFSNKPRID